jgi:hypothetical protein
MHATMLTDKLITRLHSVLFNDTMEGNEFERRQILRYFKVRCQVSYPIYCPAIYVPLKEILRCACNEMLKVISGGETAGLTGDVA